MKILKLTYNELVKQFKKPSIKIIFALILITAMVLPMFIKNIPIDKYSNNALESNKYLLDQANQMIEEYKNDKTQKGKMLYEYAVVEKEYRQLYVDYKIGFDDWRGQEAEQFRQVSYSLATIEFVLEGFNSEVVLENHQDSDPSKIAAYYEMTLAKKKEIEAELIAKKERFKSIIVNNDYMAHTEEEIKRKQEFIDTNKKTIEEYEKLKAKNPKDNEGKEKLANLEKQSVISAETINNLEEEKKILQFRLDNKIDYDLNNWKNKSIKTVEKELMELRVKLMTEKDYSSTATQQGYSMTYDEYVENYNKKKVERINKIKETWYGLENNIPSLNDIRDARSVLDGTYEIYIILAVIMVIIMGGGIVATEFSKGTIRLLLIRPVSRWKILLSKLLAILIVGFSIVILGIAILYISTGAVFGFETYKTPLLQTINGSIVHVQYIKLLMPKIFISSSSLVFIASLAFTISTLAKNTALAVGISMVLYLGIAPTTDLLVSMNQTWIVNTFLPYINASYFRLIPMTEKVLSELSGIQMQYTRGAIEILIVSLILLIVAFVTFTKKDIKN